MPPKAATVAEKEKPARSTPSIPHAKPMPEERQLPASVFQRYAQNRVPDPDAVLEMTGSIRQVGQLQPITARSIGRVADDHPEQFEIIFGETRWLACQNLHADFPVRCYVLDIDDKEAAKIHAIENFQRRDLDEIQEARSMQNMLSHGWTVEEVMNHLGRAKDHIYKRLAILKLSDRAHEAIREKNLSLHTAAMIAGLPEDKREPALDLCLAPKYQKEPLSEREALREITRVYVEPIKRAKEWEDRRKALMDEFPGALMLPYEEACEFARTNIREIEEAANVPAANYLTDEWEAKSEAHQKIELPTWGELAKKHGVQLVIACKLYTAGEPCAYVPTIKVIEAERAADPESFFADPSADENGEGEDDDAKKAAAAAERERLKAIETAIEGERLKMIEHIMSGGSMSKTALKKFAEKALLALVEYGDQDAMKMIFPVGDVGGYGETEEAIRAEISKLFKPKDANPVEIFARVAMAMHVAERSVYARCDFEGSLAGLAFETGAFKRADYPALSERFPVPAKVEEQPAPEGSAEAGA